MISVIYSLDTRPGWRDEFRRVGSEGKPLCGVRHIDFFTEGVANIRRFFEGHEIELIVYVDEHEPVEFIATADPALTPGTVADTGRLQVNADLVVTASHDASRHKWNDHVYLEALALAKGDYVCHIDHDTSLFRQPGKDPVSDWLKLLDKDTCRCVCFPMEAPLWFASTRFFITKRCHLPVKELQWCVDNPDLALQKYPVTGVAYLACLEHILGAVLGPDRIHYPKCSQDYLIFCWFDYYAGALARLNAMPYSEVYAELAQRLGATRDCTIRKVGLHVGCGPIKVQSAKTHWTNIDIDPKHEADLTMDCLNLLAHFGSGYADYIWSCHHLEHLAYPNDVLGFLSQCREVLKPGGILRLAVPSLAVVAKAYAEGSDLTFVYGKDFKGYAHYDCPAERFLFFMRAWQHTFIPDPDLMSRLLCDAGFTSIAFKKFNESAIPDWNHDRFQSESLYVEATKS